MTTMTGTLCRVLATALIVGACNSDRMGPPPPPPAAARLVVAGLPSPSVTGSFANVEVIAEDAAGHDTIVSYRGTVRFTSTDPAATLPSDYTFVPTDSGRHAFTVIFGTPGLYSVTATDVATGSITGADTVQVTSAPPAVARLVVKGLPNPSVTGSFANVEVIAEDAAGRDTIAASEAIDRGVQALGCDLRRCIAHQRGNSRFTRGADQGIGDVFGNTGSGCNGLLFLR